MNTDHYNADLFPRPYLGDDKKPISDHFRYVQFGEQYDARNLMRIKPPAKPEKLDQIEYLR